jgi:phage shock protein C
LPIVGAAGAPVSPRSSRKSLTSLAFRKLARSVLKSGHKGGAAPPCTRSKHMQSEGNLLTRDDTFFGVCQGLGEDLGFNPNLLRVVFPVALFFQPVAAIAAYAALGLVVAFARFAFPVPRAAQAEAPDLAEADAGAVMAGYAADLEPLDAGREAEPVALAA